jgi:UDP-GlcNAc3NAcA epimerase
MKVLSVVGARPQFIKAAPVSEALASRGITEVVVHTGQHFDKEMSEIFFSELQMAAPDYNLGIGGGTHGEQTGRMLPEIERVITAEAPDLVLVYGDTNSTLAGTIAAAKLKIPVAHVEAGLRSFNRRMPEEVNRVVADALADLLFVPTETAILNLHREGINRARIHLIGDVMYDTSLTHGVRARSESRILGELGLTEQGYALATIHRAENTDDAKRLLTIYEAMMRIAEAVPVVWPIHPRTQQRLDSLGITNGSSAMRVIKPVGYLDMVRLEIGAAVILTDSGGVQKEAFFHRVPCVTLREETEWVELTASGWNRLAPPFDTDTIVNAAINAIGSTGQSVNPYGDGKAATRIAEILAIWSTSPSGPIASVARK